MGMGWLKSGTRRPMEFAPEKGSFCFKFLFFLPFHMFLGVYTPSGAESVWWMATD